MRKVRDHCHYTGKYRGAAHSKCNLNYKIVKEIPVLFQNGSVYDYHFIIKYLAREFEGNSEYLKILRSILVLLYHLRRRLMIKRLNTE